ncbi:DNA topoisomerase 3-beta [Coccidioides immitis H538.4]|uniref:DNA topoisomerase n=1 Tax=Coccidioides immitis H538.4 TaxID=396776 RepID=A0A0J8RU44_COCIT|nr:DNA topoisomerase 3-beta [Coccidioides immitis H538.4]
MGARILCVAEKPAIAKAVAQHLSGGALRTVAIRGNQYVKNYEFQFSFGPPWGNSSVTMTSVIGHLTALDFESEWRHWQSCPPGQLFDAPVVNDVDKDKIGIAENIRNKARQADALFIWTDCDREGEHIGSEVRTQAVGANPRIEVKRAKFTRNPIALDERQINAVAARIELDLRIGAAFTRLLTLQLGALGGALSERLISYGSCQFPTLGFVVDRYFRVKNFKPEPFWSIKVTHARDGKTVNFTWSRGNLFDRAAVVMIFERCLTAKTAKVTKVNKKPTKKWRPLPLTTVDLQMMGSKFLRMDSQKVMKVAESLYTKGFISYPRTETERTTWLLTLFSLMAGGFKQPRSGRHNDQAHPPIHPVTYVAPSVLTADERRVYEFVVRRFLACCSDDAKGETSEVDIQYGDEKFHAQGLIVLERNYLDIYVYDKWESSQELPKFTVGEVFEPKEAKITEGKTTPPNYLTEPELIGLMDANGIGTDATMAEHIFKIKDRQYVATRRRGGNGRNSVEEFIPTKLGVALVEGYDNLVLDLADCPSLCKPFLRKEMELRMRDICAGTTTRRQVVSENLEMYRRVFVHTQRRIEVLKRSCRNLSTLFQKAPQKDDWENNQQRRYES